MLFPLTLKTCLPNSFTIDSSSILCYLKAQIIFIYSNLSTKYRIKMKIKKVFKIWKIYRILKKCKVGMRIEKLKIKLTINHFYQRFESIALQCQQSLSLRIPCSATPKPSLLFKSNLLTLQTAQQRLATHMNLSTSTYSLGQQPGYKRDTVLISSKVIFFTDRKPGQSSVQQSIVVSFKKLAMSQARQLTPTQSQSIKCICYLLKRIFKLLRSLWQSLKESFVQGSSSFERPFQLLSRPSKQLNRLLQASVFPFCDLFPLYLYNSFICFQENKQSERVSLIQVKET